MTEDTEIQIDEPKRRGRPPKTEAREASPQVTFEVTDAIPEPAPKKTRLMSPKTIAEMERGRKSLEAFQHIEVEYEDLTPQNITVARDNTAIPSFKTPGQPA